MRRPVAADQSGDGSPHSKVMSDGQTLLLLLGLLYLSDCFLWVRKQSVAFVSPWCRRWRIARLNSSLANGRGGLLFMNPLPPLGSVFLSHLSPISVSPLGICAFNLQALPLVGRPAQTGQSLAFSEINGSSADGAQLLIKVTPRDIFPNCPRYIPHLSLEAPSVHAPQPSMCLTLSPNPQH